MFNIVENVLEYIKTIDALKVEKRKLENDLFAAREQMRLYERKIEILSEKNKNTAAELKNYIEDLEREYSDALKKKDQELQKKESTILYLQSRNSELVRECRDFLVKERSKHQKELDEALKENES